MILLILLSYHVACNVDKALGIACSVYISVERRMCVCRVCPYYLSRSLKQQADIVFTPYNYLLDPKVSTHQTAGGGGQRGLCQSCHYTVLKQGLTSWSL